MLCQFNYYIHDLLLIDLYTISPWGRNDKTGH